MSKAQMLARMSLAEPAEGIYCWIATGFSLMDQTAAFLKYTEVRHPFVSIVASQEPSLTATTESRV